MLIKMWTPKIILPRILRGDNRLEAARLALERELANLSEAALEVLHLPRLDQLHDPMLDVLLNQYHADFFESDMTEETKREIIRDAIQWHRRKGTPAAVEEVAKKVFRDAHVLEWFEFEGRPFYFRILQDISAGDEDADRRTMDRLRAAVKEAKNVRSHLEFYGFLLTLEDINNPVDEQHLHINQYYIDEYDYRRNNAEHDGGIDYGESRWRHDGTFKRDGSMNRRGFIARDKHGRFQADDFEIITFGTQYHLSDTVTVDDQPSKLDFGLALEDQQTEVDTHCTMLIHQHRRHNGVYKRDGTVTHSGVKTAEAHTLTPEEFALIEGIKERLRGTYSGKCIACGGDEYSFKTGSARIGTKVFDVDDLQSWTVDIFCRNCGRLLNQYLVPEPDWEEVLT